VRSNGKFDVNTSWSTTTPSGLIKSTPPLGSLTSGPDVNPPMMIIKKKIKTNAVARFSIMALAFSKNRPSDEKIDLTVLICDSINFYK
jgi:hypothetical protein